MSFAMLIYIWDILEWAIPSQALPAHRIPFQATDGILCDQDLPPERDE